MADRTVNVRLRLDTTAFLAGERAAEQSTRRLATQATAAANTAEQTARRAATAAGGTFSSVNRQAATSLQGLQRNAGRTSQALANASASMSRETARAATQAAQVTGQSAERSAASATRATRQVAATVGEIPATFRAAGATANASMQQMARQAVASRNALTSSMSTVTQLQTSMTSATAAAASGTARLSLANRLALHEAAQASQASVAAAEASAARVSTAAALAAAGATRASEAAAAASARAAARSTAATSGAFSRLSARAREMGASVAAGAGRSERSLKAVRMASIGLLAAFAAAVYAAANFDKAMSGVRAATGAAGRELGQLRQAAIQAGSTTRYSASQAADAETELAKAGVSTADILGGALKGTLSLAAAGQLDVADSAVVAAKAMNAFGLQGKDVGHIADVMAAAAGKSATDVHGMSLAMAQSALVAHQTGLTLEQTAGALALFAQNGLVGSDAGTSLKTMLMRLTPQSKEAAGMMQKLGFSAFDASGNFVGWSETAARLHDSFKSLTPEARNAAFATIFGSDATRAATIVYRAGASGVNTWTKAANDQGYAARYAATQTDNLAGDLQRLKSALETAFIQSGSSANGMLRDMAKALTAVVRWYNQLPPGVQQSVTVLASLVGMLGLVGSGLLLMLPRIMLVRRELIALGLTAERTRVAMSALGRLGVVVGGLAAVSWATGKLMDQFKDAPPNVTKMGNALVDFAQKGRAAGELTKTFGKNLDGFGDAVRRVAHPSGMERVINAMEKVRQFGDDDVKLAGAKDKIKAVDQALADLVSSGNPDVAAEGFRRLAQEAEAQGTSTEKLKSLLPQYTDALAGADTQQKLTGDSQKAMGDQVDMTTGDLQDQRSAAEKLTDALKALNGLNIDAAEQEINFRQSLADLTAAVRENGHSLDTHTAKGRKVKSAFLDAAKAAADHAQAVADQKQSVEAGNAVLEKDIGALKRTMKAAGFTEKQIKDLTAAYAQLPPKTTTQIQAETKSAIADLEAVKRKVASTKGKTITMRAPTAEARKQLEALGFKIRNTKGKRVIISVPTGGQKAAVDRLRDAINMLRNREIRISITRYFRSVGNPQGMKNALETMHAKGGPVGRYAGGGEVQLYPQGGYVQGPGTGTSDSILTYFASGPARISDTEYVVRAAAVRRYGVPFLDAVNSGRLPKFADGGFTYTPSGLPVLGGPGDARQRYDDLISKLKDAWKQYQAALKELDKVKKHKHTKKQLDAAKKKVRDEYADVKELDKALGLKSGAKAPAHFNLAAYQKQLGKSLAATEKWRKNLEKIGKRGGEDLRALLESMGEDGYALVNSLAGASDKQFKDIAKKLKATGDLAKATLADFTKQLGAHTKESEQFSKDLQTLAARGFGDLAQALAAQGDESAMALAHQAAGSTSAAAKANSAVKKADTVLTGDDLTNALVLLSTLRSKPGAGFAELIAAGLDVSTIRALAPKMLRQINELPQMYKDEFLKELTGQSDITAMATGGILNRPTMVLGGEAGVRESWIPWDGSARSRSLLATTAAAAGYQLVPAGRYGGGHQATAALAREVTKHIEVHLYGAKQTTAEQAQDVARHLAFVG